MMLRTQETAKRLSRLGGHSDDAAGVEAVARRAKQGDERAVTEIYRRYFDRVYGYMHVALGGCEEAEDATRQVFLKAIGLISGYERREQAFSRWLFRVAHNEALDRLRRRGPAGVDPGAVERWRGAFRTDGLRARLWESDGELMRTIEELPESQRRAVLLRYVLDFDDGEIAEALASTPREVRRLQRSALRFLERRLGRISRGTVHRGAESRVRLFATGA